MARMWFTAEKCLGLTKSELGVLNRAMRILIDQYGYLPTQETLMRLRRTYNSSVSARGLAWIFFSKDNTNLKMSVLQAVIDDTEYKWEA